MTAVFVGDAAAAAAVSGFFAPADLVPAWVAVVVGVHLAPLAWALVSTASVLQ